MQLNNLAIELWHSLLKKEKIYLLRSEAHGMMNQRCLVCGSLVACELTHMLYFPHPSSLPYDLTHGFTGVYHNSSPV
jgi:hypothetical protein